jgi:aspartate aminotransferase-like enzyme
MHKKLFIPGPTEVRDEILDAMAMPMIDIAVRPTPNCTRRSKPSSSGS